MQDILEKLYTTIEARKGADKSVSYVAKLFHKGTNKIAQKVGEEAVETVIAALAEDKTALINEASDLIFHLLILLADKGVTVQEIVDELDRRMGLSGLDEKALRKMEQEN
jgi:phosphoribosyl-ATP pyrophosphohydrolase